MNVEITYTPAQFSSGHWYIQTQVRDGHGREWGVVDCSSWPTRELCVKAIEVRVRWDLRRASEVANARAH